MRKKKWIVLAILLGVCLTGCWLSWEKFHWSDRKTPVEEMPEMEEGGEE